MQDSSSSWISKEKYQVSFENCYLIKSDCYQGVKEGGANLTGGGFISTELYSKCQL